MTRIPFFDHKPMHQAIHGQLLEAMEEVLRHDYLILGPQVEAFEREFSAYLEIPFAAGVNSGLDALQLALRAMGIGPGDEVIVPANTYIATWNAVQMIGAIPVPLDPDPVTMNIRAEDIQSVIGQKTKAILPVHLYGLPCEMPGIIALAASQGLKVIEDNAQAAGAVSDGQRTGTWGHANAFSFYPTKNLGALGDAGMVTSAEEEVIRYVRSHRNYGSSARYVHEEIGLNSRLDEMQAAWLRVKLKYLDQWITERRSIAAKYRDGLESLSSLRLPPDHPAHTYHLYVIRCAERDALAAYLQEAGIATLMHYPVPPHLQKAYAYLGYRPGDFPVSEEIAKTCLSLPIYPGFTQVDSVVDQIKKFFLSR